MNVLQELKKVNELRCKNAFNHTLEEWATSQWSNAVAGEVGELCNIVKKYERGDFHKNILHPSTNPEYNNAYAAEEFRRQLSKEAADIVIYLDLLCKREYIDLGEAIVKKFNEVSDRIGSDIKIIV